MLSDLLQTRGLECRQLHFKGLGISMLRRVNK